MAEYKAGLRKAGVKPPVVEAAAVSSAREYRRAPEERLMARLGLTAYDREAPYQDEIRSVLEVKLLLSQHIGAPAAACVKPGDAVTCGDVVGAAAEGLSVSIHASVSGTVTEVTETYIMIEETR